VELRAGLCQPTSVGNSGVQRVKQRVDLYNITSGFIDDIGADDKGAAGTVGKRRGRGKAANGLRDRRDHERLRDLLRGIDAAVAGLVGRERAGACRHQRDGCIGDRTDPGGNRTERDGQTRRGAGIDRERRHAQGPARQGTESDGLVDGIATGQAGNAGRGGPLHSAAVAELAIGVAAPAQHGAIVGEGAVVVAANSDFLDAGQAGDILRGASDTPYACG